MHRLFISQNPKNHVKEPYTQKWITILSFTCTGSLSNSDAVTIRGVPERENDACRGDGRHQRHLPFLSPSHPGLGPQALPSVLWLSGGGGLEAVATQSKSNNGTQHLPFGPVLLKNDVGPTNELRQIRSRASWESLVLNRLGSLTNVCVSSFLHYRHTINMRRYLVYSIVLLTCY